MDGEPENPRPDRRALDDGRVSLNCWNPRDYASGVHRSVDDRPFGGGPGMVMRPEPLSLAIEAALAAADPAPVAYLSPQGRALNQEAVLSLAARPRLILVCGRYEGVDQRVIESLVDEEWSVGDYVLSGGRAGGGSVIDAVVRQIPGVLGHECSAQEDSFRRWSSRLPSLHPTGIVARCIPVPDVLTSGDHARIKRWRRAQALHRTQRLPA